MSSTVLADFVRDFGDLMMQELTATIYQSHLFMFILNVIVSFALIQLASDLSNNVKPVKSGIFFITWLMVMPIQNRPAFYYIINTFSIATSNLFQDGLYKVLTLGNTRKVIPPGFVYNAIIKASTAEITDPSIRSDVVVLIDYCLPDLKNKQGKALSALDLFGGKVVSSEEGVESNEYNFHTNLLSNRKVTGANGNTNCLDLLNSTRTRVRTHLRGQELTKMPDQIYKGPNNGDYDSGKYVTTWDATSSRSLTVGKIAVNLAEAHAIQKTVLEDYFQFPSLSRMAKSSEENGSLSPLTTLSKGAFNGKSVSAFGVDADPTRVITELANLPTSLGKSLNLNGAVDAGLTLQELNERLVQMPYYVSSIQLFLKVIAPFVIFLLLIRGAWGVVTAWSIAWFGSLLIPTVMIFTRTVANLVILWITKLDQATATGMADPAFLNLGVSFEAANSLMLDARSWMAIFLKLEAGIWGALLMVLPILGGVVAHYKGSEAFKKFMDSFGHTASREGSRKVIGASRSVASGAAKGLAPYAAGAGTMAVSAASGAVRKVTRFARGK